VRDDDFRGGWLVHAAAVGVLGWVVSCEARE